MACAYDPICCNQLTTNCILFIFNWWPCSPPNDLCVTAQAISLGVPEYPDTTHAGTDGGSETACGFTGASDGDVWYEFTAPSDSNYQFRLTPFTDPPDRVLAIYDAASGCPTPSDTAIKCDETAGPPLVLSHSMSAGETVLIRVGTPGGFNSLVSELLVTSATSPANDDCSNPEIIVPHLADLYAWPVDNTNATTTASAEPCGGFAGDVAGNSDSDVWFEFVSPCAQTYTFSVTPQGGGPESYLAVYAGGCPQTGGTLVGCDTGSGAATDVKTVIGETYIVRTGSPPGQQGDFELSILRPCPPDLNNDGWVDGGDLLHLLSGWGTVTPLTVCMDFNHDGVVDGLDLLYMLSWWGPCP